MRTEGKWEETIKTLRTTRVERNREASYRDDDDDGRWISFRIAPDRILEKRYRGAAGL